MQTISSKSIYWNRKGLRIFLFLMTLAYSQSFHLPGGVKSRRYGTRTFSTPLPHPTASSSLPPERTDLDPPTSSPLFTNEVTPYDNPFLFQAYKESMEQVLAFFRIMQKNDQPRDLEAAKEYLFASERWVPPVSCTSTEKEEFQKCMQEQRDLFCERSGLANNQMQLVLRALSYIGDYCAKKRISAPLHVAWDKIKESGLRPRGNALGAYLYIFSSIPLNMDGLGDPNTNGTQQVYYDPNHIPGQVAFYHDMIYKPTENTVSIRIKALVEQGHTEKAEELLWNLESVTTTLLDQGGKLKKKDKGNESRLLRLRTCLPVLKSYCEEGDISRGLKLYQKMMHAPSVHFESETYALVLSALARRGYLRQNSEPIDNMEEIGYKEGRGAALFDAIASEMSNDIVEITSSSAREIRNALAVGFASLPCARNLREVPYDCDLAPWNEPAAEDELVANRITMPNNSTICPRTNVALRLILLDDNQRQHVHDTLLNMANVQFDAFETKLQSKGSRPSKVSLEENYAGKHLENFAKWLNEREGEPFTAIVDGANVAYYGLGCINYHQLKLMVTCLEGLGENPLVIIPQKYTQKKFYLRQGYLQELPDSQMDIIKELESSGKLYEVPQRCLDDYYWMLSSVSNQTKARNGVILDVPTDNEQGRFPGTRPILVTNDQMRDHKLELLEPKLFRRWVSSHIVNYHFSPFFNDIKEDRDVQFSPADFTSREIQGNPCSDSGDTVWHFPVSDWDKKDRFCVRLPKGA